MKELSRCPRSDDTMEYGLIHRHLLMILPARRGLSHRNPDSGTVTLCPRPVGAKTVKMKTSSAETNSPLTFVHVVVGTFLVSLVVEVV